MILTLSKKKTESASAFSFLRTLLCPCRHFFHFAGCSLIFAKTSIDLLLVRHGLQDDVHAELLLLHCCISISNAIMSCNVSLKNCLSFVYLLGTMRCSMCTASLNAIQLPWRNPAMYLRDSNMPGNFKKTKKRFEFFFRADATNNASLSKLLSMHAVEVLCPNASVET